MPVMRTYQCPECLGAFEHLHLRSTDEPPSFCPLCGASTADTPPEMSAPHIGKSIGFVADAVYRQMEEGSAQRAQMAAEHLGVDAAETSALKITDIRDTMREGDTAVSVAPNAVSTFMQQSGVGGYQGSDAGVHYAAATRHGPHAGAGSRAMDSVRQQHAAASPRMVASGQQGKY